MNCWFCSGKLIWQCDYSFEDWGMDDEGIVATLVCSDKDCNASFEGFLNITENKKPEEER